MKLMVAGLQPTASITSASPIPGSAPALLEFLEMPTREPDPVRSLLFPAVVLIVGLLATWATGAALRASVQAQDAERFEWAADGLHDSITQRLDAYLAMLRAGAGVFTRPGMPTADQFAVFVERLQLEEAYPGVQGIGFAVRVSEAAVPGLVRTRAAQNAPEFTAWPDDPHVLTREPDTTWWQRTKVRLLAPLIPEWLL